MPGSKNLNNVQIAELLRDVAASYQIKNAGKNKFKIIAYERAADAIEHLSSETKDLWDDGKLTDVAGIGPSIAEHLGELFKTGHSKHFDEVMQGLAPAIFELMKVPGIGPKTALKLTEELGIKERKDAIKKLEIAIKSGKVAPIEGFGHKSQESIEKSIKEAEERVTRTILPYAEEIAGNIIAWLLKDKNVKRADVLGSLRRKVSTVGDIDIAASTMDPSRTLEHFAEYPHKNRVLEKGDRTASLIVPGNKQVDLMVETPDAYGAMLQHFTGSKHHNIALREIALKKGYSLSDYGIRKRSQNSKKPKLQKFKTEEELYKKLGMKWIPPELREDTGEIQNSLENKLPRLIELSDIKSDFHIHSDFDIETSHDLGASSMEEIIKKAESLGYKYIALSEHNPSQKGHNKKQIIDLIKRKKETIDKINSSNKYSVRVYNSLEIDILPDGNLPVSEEGLNLLDFALVSIHSSFDQSRDVMTERILSAISQPKVKIFAHPTARKLNHRESVEIDWPKIFEYCANNNKWLEINSEPMRLDLPDFLVREAVKQGVKLTMGTDAHHIDHMDNMRYGVYVARRGWAEKKDIVNTRSLEEFEKMLE